MRWIIAGVVLDVVAFVAIGILIFIPMLAPDFAPTNNLLDGLLCETGERYEPRQIVTQDIDGTGYSLYAVCIGERGERDVTPQQTIYGLVAFAAAFIPGLALTIYGASRIKANRERPREVTGQLGRIPTQPVAGSSWRDIPGLTGDPVVQNTRSLSERLAEADQAYEDRRISREEYEALRKKIIDETNF